MEYYEILSDFVRETCHGRDESHGYNHMVSVKDRSLYIYKKLGEINERIEMLIIYSAMLHDVADHKYDKNGKLREIVLGFLNDNYKDEAILIINIIDRISYNKEYRLITDNKELDWEKVLGYDGLLVRNIVSDADKLEALGKNGIHRCIIFTSICINNPQKILMRSIKYSICHLSKYKNGYIRTIPGMNMINTYHLDFIEELKRVILDNNLLNYAINIAKKSNIELVDFLKK